MFFSRVLWDVVSQPFKQSQTGLFQGKMKQYGNNVPFSKKKTRRSWLPNVQHKRLNSEILDGLIRVKLTTRALRTIKKKGGLDTYLKTTSQDILGDAGMRLRLRVLEEERRKNGRTPTQYQVLKPVDFGTTSPYDYYQSSKDLHLNQEVTDETAHLARVLATKALGRPPSELASAAETIAFLKEKYNQREVRRSSIFSETTSEPASPLSAT